MKQNLSLLQNFKVENFYLKPFPHLIIKDCLPDDLYLELEKNTPNDLINEYNENNKRGNIILNDIKNNKNYSLWTEFLKYNSSKEFFKEFFNIFENNINLIYPSLFNKIKKYADVIDQNKIKINEIKQSASYCFNTPVKTPTSVRGIHIDNFDKLYLGLFYMRNINDLTKGGDLIIYNWKKNYNLEEKKKILYTEKFKYLDKHTEENKKIEYSKNTFFLGLNTIDSLHGVSIRERTNHVRQFCYLSSRLKNKKIVAESSFIEKINYDNISTLNKIKIIIFETKELIKKILFIKNKNNFD